MSDKESIRMMDHLGIITHLDIFDCESIQSLIDFKWTQYAKNFHYVMFTVNIVYLGVFYLFVRYRYLFLENNHTCKSLLWAMLGCNTVFMIYDLTQLTRQGSEYFSEIWNLTDQLLVWVSYINFYL